MDYHQMQMYTGYNNAQCDYPGCRRPVSNLSCYTVPENSVPYGDDSDEHFMNSATTTTSNATTTDEDCTDGCTPVPTPTTIGAYHPPDGGPPQLGYFVPISPVFFRSPQFRKSIRQALGQGHLPPSNKRLQKSESAAYSYFNPKRFSSPPFGEMTGGGTTDRRLNLKNKTASLFRSKSKKEQRTYRSVNETIEVLADQVVEDEKVVSDSCFYVFFFYFQRRCVY
uniref:Uncharacterized protein n=1 Tax=Anopheles maculatus TaxID=74869 RepID=A0A182T6R6_9DIPT